MSSRASMKSSEFNFRSSVGAGSVVPDSRFVMARRSPNSFGVNSVTAATSMSKDDKIITRGRFKGKKITFASTERIEEFTQLADDFMEKVFDLEPGEYLITDESDVLDFTEMASSDTSEIWHRIEAIYGVALADVGSE